VVDAVESPAATLNDANIFEVAKAVSLTNHIYSGQYVLMSEKVFQRLSPTEQKALLEASHDATEWQHQEAIKQQAATLELIQAKWGVKVYPVDTKPMQEAVKPVYQDFSKSIGGGSWVDDILKM
jgi:TRAP-type C4-dicarboxylate transport system substrate-binding protein